MYFPDFHTISTKIIHQVFFAALLAVSLINSTGSTADSSAELVTTGVESELEAAARDLTLNLIQEIVDEAANAIENPEIAPEDRITAALVELNLDSVGWQDAPKLTHDGNAVPLELRVVPLTQTEVAQQTGTDDNEIVLSIRSKPGIQLEGAGSKTFQMTTTFTLSI